MTKQVAVKKDAIIESLILNGDISKLSAQDKVTYYNRFCESLNLNPLTRPFQILKLQGKEVLYATKDATEQLRKINGVSVESLDTSVIDNIMTVKVKVKDKAGRTDISTGAVNVQNLKGNDLANAIMKAETKAKRRATLSICGLGILDETEIETIQKDAVVQVKEAFDGKVVDIEKPHKTLSEDTQTSPSHSGTSFNTVLNRINKIDNVDKLDRADKFIKDHKGDFELNEYTVLDKALEARAKMLVEGDPFDDANIPI